MAIFSTGFNEAGNVFKVVFLATLPLAAFFFRAFFFVTLVEILFFETGFTAAFFVPFLGCIGLIDAVCLGVSVTGPGAFGAATSDTAITVGSFGWVDFQNFSVNASTLPCNKREMPAAMTSVRPEFPLYREKFRAAFVIHRHPWERQMFSSLGRVGQEWSGCKGS